MGDSEQPSTSAGSSGSGGGSSRPSSILAAYFDFDAATKRSKCKIDGCTTTLAGTHTGNREKHIMRKHPVEANQIVAERIKLKRTSQPCGSGSSDLASNDDSLESQPSDSTAAQSSVGRKRKKMSTVTIEMDKKRLLDAAVELVTVNGRPYSIFEDSGLRSILDPIVQALAVQEPHVAINRAKVQNEVVAEAQRVREEIRREVKGRLVCIKADTATRLDRCVMGLNAQYCRDGRVILRNLGVQELHSRHTSENLKGEINSMLEGFGITPQMVYSVTTDNASNMIKTVQLMASDVDIQDDAEDVDDDCDEPVVIGEGISCELVEERWASTFEALSDQYKQEGIYGQRCGAHTLQLAVDDALKDQQASSLLKAARTLCKKLRTPTVAYLLKHVGRGKPSLDCPTRWHSSLDMVLSLLSLRDVCQEKIPNCRETTFSDDQWEGLREVADALMPAKIATKMMQSEQLLMGDFLEHWLRCKIDTNKVVSPLAQSLYDAMEKREKKLFESPAVLCAIYMDLRWHVMLTPEQQTVAQQHLLTVWHRLEALREKPDTEPLVAPADAPMDDDVGLDDDPLEKLLRRREAALAVGTSTPTLRRNVREMVASVTKMSRVPRSEDILNFWESKKLSNPELYELATTVLALPATQVSVERIFSHLKFVLSALRSRLSSNVVNDTLLVRCNRIFKRKEESNT